MLRACRGGEQPFAYGYRSSKSLPISRKLKAQRPRSTMRALEQPKVQELRMQRIRSLDRQRQPGIHSVGNQILPELIDGRKLQALNSVMPRGLDIFDLVVQESVSSAVVPRRSNNR